MHNCKYAEFGCAHTLHNSNQIICIVFGSKSGVYRASNCRHICNANGDTVI